MSRRSSPARYPNVAAIAMAASHEGGLGGCDDDVEFAFGLDLILDGLERSGSAESRATTSGDGLRGRLRTGERSGVARAVSPRWPCPG